MNRLGLCASCCHHERVSTRRGIDYHRCRLSTRDERFPKYPPLPVQICDGHEPADAFDSEREQR